MDDRKWYAGICKCGRVLMAHASEPPYKWWDDSQKKEYMRDVAKFCADVIKAGLTLELKPVDWVSEHLDDCCCIAKELVAA